MDTSLPLAPPVSSPRALLVRRVREFRLIARDPALFVGVLAAGAFILTFIVWPLVRVIVQGFFTPDGEFSLQYFARYFEPGYSRVYWEILGWTLEMGILTALGSTALGFLFAYTVVRCDIPFKGLVHALTLLPTISPPFAIALAAILLFGRAGLVTRDILHMQSGPGINDIYGLDGIIFCQIITFFAIAYLILRGLLERIDPSMEEAALSLGASKWHIFRTVTLPLMTPGIAAAFLLMFVESLADLGNPILIGGNITVLSTQIWIAVNGEHDLQKGAALSLVLLLPTLTVFVLQRYWVSRRSYIAVTGKPTSGAATFVKEPFVRWTFITLTTLVLLLILALYVTIFVGSITKLWGINNSLDLSHYEAVFKRGLEAILDTTFLSALATPMAGIAGVVIAFLVVRKTFSGKEAVDFMSNLGGAVPGTILGIGYILAFIRAPMFVVAIVYAALAYFFVSAVTKKSSLRWLVFGVGSLIGIALAWLSYDEKLRSTTAFNILSGGLNWMPTLEQTQWLFIGAGILGALALASLVLVEGGAKRRVFLLLAFMALYLLSRELILFITEPLAVWGRRQGGDYLPAVITTIASWITLVFQPPLAILGFTYIVLGGFIVGMWGARTRLAAGIILLAVCCALIFYGEPLALVGSAYIVLAAYAVRSLPATVRASVASLQQIDPAIEEASTSLGGDAQHTFRRVTLPLILPAFIAGLIFSFARHMTSLSAIIFLTTPKWPILTALILSEVEQGGVSLAAAYSIVLIVIVLAAIGLLYLWAGRAFRVGSEITMGGG
ncbi:MAG: iron ABC transporter permease [Chloroflexota bacterium]|nr:MAG: iron ABC transporter permease [Chloroflexota bacterium]